MKKIIFLLFFLPIFTFGQIIPNKPDFIPDCDKGGTPFRSYKNGIWKYNNGAIHCFGQILVLSGELVNPSSIDIKSKIDGSRKNPIMKVNGYNSGISEIEGKFCISFSEEIGEYDAFFLFRIDYNWVIYLRVGCENPILVYEPLLDREFKKLKEKKCCDTVLVNVYNTINNNMTEMKCPEVKKDTFLFSSGCPKDNWSAIYPLFGMRTIYSSDLNKESAFAGLGFRINWTDTCKLYSVYTGADLTAFVVEKTEITCDTCTEFVDIAPKKLSFRGEIFGGVEFGIRKLTNLKSFGEIRYSILQPQVLLEKEDRQFLPKHSGLTMSAGLRYNIGIFETSGFYEYDPLAKMSGGGIKISILFGRNKKSQKNRS